MKPFYIFTTLPTGQEVQVQKVSDQGGIVIAIATGSIRNEEGTKTIWTQLEERDQYWIDL